MYDQVPTCLDGLRDVLTDDSVQGDVSTKAGVEEIVNQIKRLCTKVNHAPMLDSVATMRGELMGRWMY